MATPNFRPLGDRVLVQPLEEGEVKKGGIIIPDTAKEKPQEAKIIAIGTGKMDASASTAALRSRSTGPLTRFSAKTIFSAFSPSLRLSQIKLNSTKGDQHGS